MARIVLADDEAPIRFQLRDALEAAGHTVRLAANGREALALIDAEPPELAVIDMMMPYLDGYAVLDQLRAAPATRETPVLLLTGKCAEVAVFRRFTYGLWDREADFLVKPCEPGWLLAKVEWLTRTGHYPPLVLVAAPRGPALHRLCQALGAAGLRVYEAWSDADAAEFARLRRPDLVIADPLGPELEAALATEPPASRRPILTAEGEVVQNSGDPTAEELSVLVRGLLTGVEVNPHAGTN